jgi:alkylation response protein AidB-like acyl-CoA dehydrogenase
MVRKATAMFEAQRDCGAEANMGKMLAADAAWHAAEACMQTFGGFAFAREYGIKVIVVGKTQRPWHRRIFRGSIVDRLTRESTGIDIVIVDV